MLKNHTEEQGIVFPDKLDESDTSYFINGTVPEGKEMTVCGSFSSGEPPHKPNSIVLGRPGAGKKISM